MDRDIRSIYIYTLRYRSMGVDMERVVDYCCRDWMGGFRNTIAKYAINRTMREWDNEWIIRDMNIAPLI